MPEAFASGRAILHRPSFASPCRESFTFFPGISSIEARESTIFAPETRQMPESYMSSLFVGRRDIHDGQIVIELFTRHRRSLDEFGFSAAAVTAFRI